MTAIVVRELGPPEVLRLERCTTSAPGPGQVEVAVAYAGVNFTDTEHAPWARADAGGGGSDLRTRCH